jgi:hypothetical protein
MRQIFAPPTSGACLGISRAAGASIPAAARSADLRALCPSLKSFALPRLFSLPFTMLTVRATVAPASAFVGKAVRSQRLQVRVPAWG